MTGDTQEKMAAGPARDACGVTMRMTAAPKLTTAASNAATANVSRTMGTRPVLSVR